MSFLKSKSFWAFVTNAVALLSAFFLNAQIPDVPAVMGDDFDPTLPKGDLLTWIVGIQALVNFLASLFGKKESPPQPPIETPPNLRVFG
jgi:hypothetical protein